MAEMSIARYRRSPEPFLAMAKRWRSNNPGAVSALRAKREKRILQATPPWADMSAIKAVYVAARELNKATSVAHDVDHIVPIGGKNVCGLHVHWNLRPLDTILNRRKGNKMPEESECIDISIKE